MATNLYDTDFFAWAADQAAALRASADTQVDTPAPIDWGHLIEEVDELARARLRELRSRYAVLLTHLLKWQYQQDRRSAGWRAAIVEQRNQIEDLLDENPSLKRVRTDALARLGPVPAVSRQPKRSWLKPSFRRIQATLPMTSRPSTSGRMRLHDDEPLRH